MLAGLLAMTTLGRKYTMVLGALSTSEDSFPYLCKTISLHARIVSFFFAYSQVKNNAQNLGFSCAVNFCLNIYYGTLYAYTPEVLPSAHRETGDGVTTALKSTMGIISAVIAVVSLLSTI